MENNSNHAITKWCKCLLSSMVLVLILLQTTIAGELSRNSDTVNWQPLIAQNSNFDRYTLEIDPDGKLIFRPSDEQFIIGLVFGGLGLFIAAITIWAVARKLQISKRSYGILSMGGVLMLFSALFIFVGWTMARITFDHPQFPKTFDKASGDYDTGFNVIVPISNITAIQLVSRLVYQPQDENYTDTQLILVMNDRLRDLLVVYTDDRRQAVRDARILSDYLGVEILHGLPHLEVFRSDEQDLWRDNNLR